MPQFEVYSGYLFLMNSISKLRQFAYVNLTMRIVLANRNKVLIWMSASGEGNTHRCKNFINENFLHLYGLFLNIYLSFPSCLQCPYWPFSLAKVSTLQSIANLYHSSVSKTSIFSIIIIHFFINLFYPLLMKKNIVYTFTYYMCLKLGKAF